jgi:hypothetical protein
MRGRRAPPGEAKAHHRMVTMWPWEPCTNVDHPEPAGRGPSGANTLPSRTMVSKAASDALPGIVTGATGFIGSKLQTPTD